MNTNPTFQSAFQYFLDIQTAENEDPLLIEGKHMFQ